MQKQFLLAIVLSFLVIYGWQALYPPPRPTPAQRPAAELASGPANAIDPAQPQGAPTIADTPLQIEQGVEKDVIVENAAVKAVFTTKGAALKSWRLKLYKD